MKIRDSVAFVTGANRGLGLAFAQELLAAGARKVYAAARDPKSITLTGAIAVSLDVTKSESVAAAARAFADVNLLINNAGICLWSGFLSPNAVDVARALAGHRVILNLWAYWCAPCAAELPAMADYQRRVGSDVMVVTVHQDENETAALLRLAELGVRLPTLQDGRRRVAAALSVVNVMPATVVLRPDGSVAQTLPRPFSSADEIAAAVGNDAG